MNKLKKLITRILVFAIMLSIIPTNALAKDESINVLKEDFIYKYSGVITATLLVIGVGSVAELIKQMGKEAAKEWVEKHVKKSVVNKLTAIGLGAFGTYAGNIIKGIVDAYVDPGQWLAEKIDGIDKISSNGYIELW